VVSPVQKLEANLSTVQEVLLEADSKKGFNNDSIIFLDPGSP
jgi:hypothetical protein